MEVAAITPAFVFSFKAGIFQIKISFMHRPLHFVQGAWNFGKDRLKPGSSRFSANAETAVYKKNMLCLYINISEQKGKFSKATTYIKMLEIAHF